MRISLLVLFFSFSLLEASPLKLDDAISKLKSSNLEVEISDYEIKSAQEKKSEAFASYLGKLDFIQDVARSNDAGNVFGFKVASREASFGDFGFTGNVLGSMSQLLTTQPTAEQTAAFVGTQPDELNKPDARNFFQSKLRYEVPLFTGFKLSSYNTIMSAMVEMKRLDKKELLSKKSYELKKSYYNYLLLEKTANKLAEIFKNMKVLENTTSEMIAIGYAKNIDLLEIQAEISDVERLQIEVNSNKELLLHYVSFLLNEEVKALDVDKLQNLELDALDVDGVLNSNIQLQKVAKAVTMRKESVTLQRSAYMPMVGAFGEVATADNTLLGDAKDHLGYSVGARLQWNIFNGLADSAKIEEAKIELLKMESSLELAKKGIILQVSKKRTEILNDSSVIDHLQKELRLSQEISKNYSERYKEKLVSINDVLIKQSQEIQKNLQLLQAENLKNEHILELEKIIGK